MIKVVEPHDYAMYHTHVDKGQSDALSLFELAMSFPEVTGTIFNLKAARALVGNTMGGIKVPVRASAQTVRTLLIGDSTLALAKSKGHSTCEQAFREALGAQWNAPHINVRTFPGATGMTLFAHLATREAEGQPSANG